MARGMTPSAIVISYFSLPTCLRAARPHRQASYFHTKPGSAPFLFVRLFICTGPTSITAIKTKKAIQGDGRLDEQIWQEAPQISSFTEQERDQGSPVSERTEVAVVYDKTNLYIGVWCYDSNTAGIIAQA